ncbi:MAG: c-type cytochrome domain-containing protein [Isosphaeraceae bacterium]
MSSYRRFRTLGGVLLVAAALTVAALAVTLTSFAHARTGGPQDPAVQDPTPRQEAGQEGRRPSGDAGESSPRGRRPRAATPKTARKAAPAGKSAGAGPEDGGEKDRPGASSPQAVSFKQDIGPILVANCVGCHSPGRPGLTRGKLDMTSFARLMAGTPREKVITPGKPDESHLVRRIRGEETPRMPQGGNNNGLAEEAIGRIERWIRAGAVLDAGIDPKAAMETYASSPEQVRRNLLARMSARERDQLVEKAGRDRWKKANPRLAPEIAHSEHFIIFSNLPKERASHLAKSVEAQHGLLRRLLGASATNWAEKVSVYVFNSRKDLVELTRSLDGREIDADTVSVGNLAVAQPYLAVVDPLGGKKEDPAAARRKPRGKRAEEKEPDSPTRSLIGLVASSLGEAAIAAEGKSPRWLAYGFGGFLGAQAEPRSPYHRRLRQHAHQRYDQGWITRATDVLGETDQATAEDLRGIGLAIVEYLLSPDLRAAFPVFLDGMSRGKEKLDDALEAAYGVSREDFLNSTGEWVARQYGQGE